ncbi:Metallo-beta-lactamase superfamily [Rubrobacter radiotolerans]|uniref:MBL fold metallo-hydrolase n=1 Tax=Rubrobacter radiotolerans TaxID=42256 RepID=A0A023WZX8_RUBRA|nr:MBL fold metallo-hydrolase [Rubrobacter radiotolerans]AHY45613.1 Metallo-beta-lactamase superfamily [Rubrobacter radiotolerans]MDX5893026.1 MBL fold metallo-hydrolase [Rubrobacter radiotolerans]SMC02926.1 Glyoxylase, beta-lactamase superfamily II [Rubrobacter radiotolerans DSM 5868]
MSRPEKLAEGVYRVDAIGIPRAVNVLLIREGDGFTLVDTGVRTSVGRIEAALRSLGGGTASLKRVFLTHYHDDHTGGLEGLLGSSGEKRPEVWASDREAEIFTGERPADLSHNPVMRRLMRSFDPPRVEVARRLREGETVAGFRVVPTPGHTHGHVSLLRESDGLLFTADAFGTLPLKIRVGVRSFFCTDPVRAKRSAAELLDLDFRTAVLAHGPVLREGAKERLRRAVAECRYA